VVVSRGGAPVRADVSPPRGAPDLLRSRADPFIRRSARRALGWLVALAAYSPRRRAGGATPYDSNRTTSLLMPRAEARISLMLPRGPLPDLRRSATLSHDIRAFACRRLFKATACARSGRLPSMRSPALHRGSTRAIPFDRSRAFAPHPFARGRSRLLPVTGIGVRSPALSRPSPRPKPH
jgi:hypothetical protein